MWLKRNNCVQQAGLVKCEAYPEENHDIITEMESYIQ
jgi:hypothetical protein